MIDLAPISAAYAALIASIDQHFDDHSPGAIWRRAERASRANSPKVRRWKARALGLNPEPLHNAIALAGMAPIMFEDSWHLGVALPQPCPVGGLLDQVDDVVLIDPVANTAQMMGDRGATHVGPRLAVERLPVTTDPKQWARDIALHRLEWYRLRAERRRTMQAEPYWSGDIPSALIIGSPKKVRWSDFDAKIIDVPADMQRTVQRAIFAQARLPRVEGRA